METNQTPASRVIFIRSPRRMTEEQLRAALGSMEENDPRFAAVNQIIDEELASAVLDASDPQLDASKGTYPGGRVSALAEVKKRLHDYRQAPVKKAAPAAAAAKARGKR